MLAKLRQTCRHYSADRIKKYDTKDSKIITDIINKVQGRDWQ